jgi:sterol 3beta-glucosyltransferase
MRVLIVTAGSRGDVAPFTGLGRRLQQAGHRVAIAAHVRFADLVRESGLRFRPLPGDPVELVRARTAAPTPEAARAVFAAFLDELGDGVRAAVTAGADVVLTAFGPAPLSRAVAGSLGIPSAGVYLAPGVPTREFPPPGGPSGWRQVIDGAGNLYAGVLRRMGLPAPSEPLDDWPVFHGFSPAVVSRPTDWPAAAEVTGYWWPDRPAGWQPPDRLTEFLAAGPPPVFVGFGSMTPNREHLPETVAEAVRRVGVRAIVQSGWADLTPPGSGVTGAGPDGDDVLVVGDVPHDWLFPRMAAVVHHAGAGTTGAGLRAGVPAVAVPVLVDQPFWADRLHRLGVAPRPLPMAELTADTLTVALRSCLDRPAHRDHAAELAHRLSAEDGPAAVLAHIEHLARPPGSP